ncbi:MAG: S41 family peptidase [Parashewanella sp.]
MYRKLRSISLVFVGFIIGVSASLNGREPFPNHHLPLFADILDSIERYYVKPIPKSQLVDAAIKGMLTELDDYSEYQTPQQISQQQANNNGQYYGFGFEVNQQGEHITITDVFANSPAEQAGIAQGDKIIGVNERVLSSENRLALMSEIRQAADQKQPLSLTLRTDSHQKRQISLQPKLISIPAVTASIIDDNIGYIKLNGFQKKSYLHVKATLIKWQDESLIGLIIDLRNNPGGLLQQAIKVADLFIPQGVIVSTKGRFAEANSKYSASPLSLFNQLPMLVLIDKHSASAAEVLAAALQQNHRATLMGETSFGKGSIQGMIPTLNPSNQLKLTIANYLTPKGDNIHDRGITPDILISPVPANRAEFQIKKASVDASLLKQHNDMVINQAINWIKDQT